jgi:hypothetical protein
MNTLRTDVNAWLHTQSHVVAGRSFPYGEFSCVPLAPEESTENFSPVGFLLSKGDSIAIIEPAEDSPLWQHLVAEMAHWHAHPGAVEDLPAECWYG